MNKDGSNLTCLDDTSVYNPIVYEDYVYYLKDLDNSKVLCRIPTNGGQIEMFSKFDTFTFHFYIFKNELYIYDSNACQLIAFHLHSKKRTVIINQTAIPDFCIENGFLYCQLADVNGFSNKLYIHPLDASPSAINLDNGKTITLPQGIYEFNVSNGIIYASSNTIASRNGKLEEDGIWRINRDGSGLKKIYTGNATQLQIIDQKIYFEDDVEIYQMDLDGGHLRKFDENSFFYLQN